MPQIQWWRQLLLLMLVGHIAAADNDVLYEVAKKFSEEKPGCELPENVHMDTQCHMMRLDEIRGLPARTVPPGAVCMFNPKEIFTYTCTEKGIWIQDKPTSLPSNMTAHHRGKRWILAVLLRAGPNALMDLGLLKKLLCLLICKKKPQPRVASLMPPKITCPKVPSPQHPLAGKSMKVTWEQPFASDRMDGPIDSELMKGKPPGSNFDEGKHFVYYKAKNSKGLTAYCTINFVVEVSRCPRPKWPWNAKMNCDDEQLSGSVCTFTCKIGYQLEGDSQIMCLKTKWVGTIPKCIRKVCPSPPKVENAELDCPSKLEYASTCAIKCNRGYVSEGTPMILCNSTGTWTQPGTCRDLKAPSFPSGCVEDQRALAGPRDEPTVVTWEKPNVTDNSGSDVTITYSHEPGSRFPLGRTTVVVQAKDKSKNVIKCSFAVFVEAEVCKDPTHGNSLNGGDLLIYDCPNGTSLGYSCKVSCKSDYPLVGSPTVTCSKDSKSGKIRWTWEKGQTKPYCKSTDCPRLREPINGAISCDKWNHGRFCSMHCNADFDVPRRVPTPWYVCGMATGKWRPHGIVQDCIVRRRPNKMRLPAEMYYHSATCPGESAKKEMSKSFINMLTNSPLFREECGERVPDCKPEMVNVRCGEEHGMNATDVAVLYKKFFKDITNSIETLTKTGKLEMEGYKLTNSSFAPGVPTIDCPKGTQPRFDTGSCSGCPTGTFYNETSDFCDGCAKGDYQDDPYSTSCKRCPEGKTTAMNGSRTEQNCTEMCQPGFYSKYGIIPCIPCPTGTYQDRRGQSVCSTCAPGLTTLDMGVNTSDACTAYDMKVVPAINTTLGEITVTSKPISIYSWLFIGESATEATIFEFTTSENTKLSARWLTNKVNVLIGSEMSEAKGELLPNEWHHMALTLDSTSLTISLYIDGKLVFMKTTSNFPRINSNILLKCTVKTSAVTYSGLNVIDRVLGQSDLTAMSSTCNRTISESIFTPNMTVGKMISPSRCDAFDDCASRPCGDHKCINEVDGYTCQCEGGYKGDNCDIPPDNCLHNMCHNDATCVSDATNYTCQCRAGFRGDLCEETIVNGEWSPWVEWTFCSRVCGGGTRTRTRKCDNPPPDPDGRKCKGNATQKEKCNADPCQVCSPLKRAYGVVTSCQTTDDLTTCTIKCRDDLVFAEEPLPLYECGQKTGYKWNHQTDGHPDGRLPACTPVRGANAYNFKRSITLPTLPCTPDGKSEKTVTSQVASHSSDMVCVKQNLCKPQVDVRKCPSGRGRRGAGTSVTMTITTKMGKDTSLDLGKLLNNNTMTIGMKNYLRSMLMFEQSAQEVVNNSAKVFSVTINGVKYQPDVKSATTDVVVECKAGEVESAGACSKCPAGAREEKGSCVLCEKGHYQDRTGATSCPRCSKGKTTLGVGAQSQAECIVSVESADDVSNDQVSTQESPVVDEKPAADHTLIIVLSVMITAMVLSITAAAIIWIVKIKKHSNGSLAWGESGRNKINPGTEDENAPPPYPAVYVPPPPPPYTPMDALNPGTPHIRPNTASDVQLRVMAGANSPNINVKGVPAATQTSLGPTPSTTPRSSRNPSPNRNTPSPTPSPNHSRASSRSASPARNLASTVNSRPSSRNTSPIRCNSATGKTSQGAPTIETRNLLQGPTVPGQPTHGTQGRQSRSSSPSRQLRSPTRSPSPARSLADSVGVSKNMDLTIPPPAATYTASVPLADAPLLSPVRKINTGDPYPRSKSPTTFISSS